MIPLLTRLGLSYHDVIVATHSIVRTRQPFASYLFHSDNNPHPLVEAGYLYAK